MCITNHNKGHSTKNNRNLTKWPVNLSLTEEQNSLGNTIIKLKTQISLKTSLTIWKHHNL